MSTHLLSQILSGLQVILGVALIVLVLMHSGKDAGLSGMLNPGGSSYGGTAVMERNLTRLTIVITVIFTANVIALGFLL
jgi:preprotein translocase subunit SecG